MSQDDALRTSFQVLTEIAIIGHLADTALAQNLPRGLSVAGFGVLNHFVRLGLDGESPARLARVFQVTKGAMTYTLQRLEEDRLVTSEPDPEDARAKIVRITAKGRRMRERGADSVHPGMIALLNAIGADEFARALPFLVKLRQVLDAARD
ncbi:MAG: winged helix-turn-helix transcriptional regulator [Hyphomonadaceae bacterium]|nr:winged helix-turn-helix transcriptional regulator [Hyphomonadaceae bacterium]